MSNNKFTYEIVEENENPLQTKFVKKNVDVPFTMQEMDSFTEQANKQLEEMRSQLNLEDAKMQNTVNNHEDAISLVSELDPIKQEAIFIWLQAKRLVDILTPKRDALQEALKEHEMDIEEIKKQTGWKIEKETSEEKSEETT